MADQILIFDTTLRDGEQSPGCSMNLEEKLRVAAQLEALGVDIIEAGFAIASEGDFEAVQAVARQCDRAIVASLARAARADIERAAAALKPAKRPRIHTFIATSPLHMKVKLSKSPAARRVSSVPCARSTFASMPNWRHCCTIIVPARVITGRKSPSTMRRTVKGLPSGPIHWLPCFL